MKNDENIGPRCITLGASPSMHHPRCITLGASPSVHHPRCITFGASAIIIIDILESYHFQKYGTCWVF